MNEPRPSRPAWWGALASLVIPLLVVGPTLGSWKTPGVRAEPLFETLVGAHETLLTPSPLGTATLRLLSLVFDPVFSLGILDFLGLWLAGYGGWRLGERVAKGAIWPAVLGLAALQLSPIVLRGLCTGEAGVLAVGLGALGLASGPIGAVYALCATLWCWPVGLVALAGRRGCRRTLALALPALLLLAFAPASEDAGSLRQIPREEHVITGYVTEAGAVLPLPVPALQAPPPPTARAAIRGLYGGLAALIGALIGLALGPRLVSAVGIGIAILLFSGMGLLPSPELPGGQAAAWLGALALPGLGVQGVPWGGAVALAGAAGWIHLANRTRAATAVGLVLVVFSALVENPRVALPVANLPPDPGINALRGVAPGDVVVFPSPLAPWRQSGRGEAEHRWYALSHDRREASPELSAAVIGRLSAIANVPVDLHAAQLIWDNRDTSLDAVRLGGAPYLLLDRRSLPPEGKGPLEGWLATHIGPPLAQGDDYALYTFEMEGQDSNNIE